VTGTGLFNRVAVGRASRARSVRALDSTPTAEPLPRRGARGRTSRRPRKKTDPACGSKQHTKREDFGDLRREPGRK
jgi:hypothetical protein